MHHTAAPAHRRALGSAVLLGMLALSACSSGAKSTAPASATLAVSPSASAPVAGSPMASPSAVSTSRAAVSGGSTPGAAGCAWQTMYPHTYAVDEFSRQDGGVLSMVTPGHWRCGGAGATFVADGTSRPMTAVSGVVISVSAPFTGDSHPSSMTIDQLHAAVREHPHKPFEVTTDADGQIVRLESIYQQ